MYAYNFEGRRYDVGSKLGFLQATVEFALKREDLSKEFKKYLIDLLREDLTDHVTKEIAATRELMGE